MKAIQDEDHDCEDRLNCFKVLLTADSDQNSIRQGFGKNFTINCPYTHKNSIVFHLVGHSDEESSKSSKVGQVFIYEDSSALFSCGAGIAWDFIFQANHFQFNPFFVQMCLDFVANELHYDRFPTTAIYFMQDSNILR